jgi:Mn-dependent DtxR family transcriptional regulator
MADHSSRSFGVFTSTSPDRFPPTQDFLAKVLGIHRPTVSDIARRIHAQGMIRYSRGVVTISDLAQLERTACDCYRIVKAEFNAIRNGRPKSR